MKQWQKLEDIMLWRQQKIVTKKPRFRVRHIRDWATIKFTCGLEIKVITRVQLEFIPISAYGRLD